MPGPDPTSGVLGWCGFLVGIEPGEVHGPDVAFARWEWPIIGACEPLEAVPGKREFNGPTSVPVPVLVDGSVDMNGGAFSRESPIELAQASAARMGGEPNSVEGFEFIAGELRRTGKSAFLVGFGPDEEHFITGIEGVQFEFVVGVASGDKELDIIVVINGIVAIGVFCMDEGFLDAVGEVKVFLVPYHLNSGVVEGGFAGDDVDETRGFERVSPHGFIEFAVDANGGVDEFGGVLLDLVFGAGEGPGGLGSDGGVGVDGDPDQRATQGSGEEEPRRARVDKREDWEGVWQFIHIETTAG